MHKRVSATFVVWLCFDLNCMTLVWFELCDLNLLFFPFSHTIEDMAAPFRHLSNLQVLTLSRNQIKSVGNQALIGLSSLQELDLSDNIISTIQENSFAHLPQLHTIKINSDSLLCDCYLKWFPKWVNETKVRGGQARCAHPENLKGRGVTQIPYESFTCDDFPKPYILKQPETQITLHGNNVTLFCRAASTSPAEMTFVWKHDDYVVGSVGNGSDCVGRCIHYRSHSFDGKGREVTSGNLKQFLCFYFILLLIPVVNSSLSLVYFRKSETSFLCQLDRQSRFLYWSLDLDQRPLLLMNGYFIILKGDSLLNAILRWR